MTSSSILVPPEAVVILNDKGKEVSSVIGPYNEGSHLKLVCEVKGGKERR